VENFVVECRRKVQLEMLRNDLHVYLKILQSAMVELINKDYADFVNLSTNLVRYCHIHYFLMLLISCICYELFCAFNRKFLLGVCGLFILCLLVFVVRLAWTKQSTIF